MMLVSMNALPLIHLIPGKLSPSIDVGKPIKQLFQFRARYGSRRIPLQPLPEGVIERAALAVSDVSRAINCGGIRAECNISHYNSVHENSVNARSQSLCIICNNLHTTAVSLEDRL